MSLGPSLRTSLNGLIWRLKWNVYLYLPNIRKMIIARLNFFKKLPSVLRINSTISKQ